MGFNCYSSTDLTNWTFENQVLSTQDSGLLGPNRLGERVKVMKCPKTGGYAVVTLLDRNKLLISSTMIDFYCKYPESSLRFISPILKRGSYTLVVTATNEHSSWANKNREQIWKY